MAKATGSIVVNANPNAINKDITIDDGQGGAFSSITFRTTTAASHPGASLGNGAPLALRTNNNVQNTTPTLFARFGGSSTTWNYAALDDDWGLDGTRPAKLLISDSVGSTISITFSTSTSSTSGTSIFSGTNSNARKVSTGVYEVSIDTTGRTGHVMFGVYKCVKDAIDNDSFSALVRVLNYSNGSDLSSGSDGSISSVVLELKAPGQGVEHAGISVGLERASGTWSASTGTDFMSVGWAYNNAAGLGQMDGPNEAVYSMRSGPYDSGSTDVAFSASELADFIKKQINAMPIGITATVSSTTVSLTNDEHGTDGNVTITTTDSTNFSVSGMSGGSSAVSNLDETVSSTISASGGADISAGGTSGDPVAVLTIASGSLASETTIQVDLSGDSDPASNGLASQQGLAGAVAYSNLVRLTPHGTSFSSAATLKFEITGTNSGSCPSDLQVWKRGSGNDTWYQLPSHLWSCSSGEITISTTSFSDYLAIGGNTMARTQFKPFQLSKLDVQNKALIKAIDLTGSLATQNGASSVSAGDLFILQSSSGEAQAVSASVMQDFFSNVDVTASSANASLSIVLNQANGLPLAVDNNSLTFNPSTNALTVDGAVSGAAGTFDALAGTALALQSGGITAAGAIAGATTVSGSGQFSMSHIDLDGTLNAGGKVTVVGVSDLDGGIDVNGSNFTVSTAGAVVAESSISGAAGTFDALAGTSLALQSGGITAAGAIAGATSISGSGTISGHALDIETDANVAGDLTVVGDLVIQGTTTTIDTTNLLVEDSLIEIARGDNGARASNAGAGLYISGSVLGNDISLVAAADGGRLKVSGSTAGFDVQSGGDYAINGTSVLTSTTLGSAVVNSSLTSLGTQAEALDMGSQGITNAGAIAGATTIAASSNATIEGIVSGAAGTFDALAGTSLALQSGGITAAGAIAGATTVSGSGQFSMSHIDLDGTLNAGGKVTVVGVSDLDGGIDVNGSNFTVSTSGAVVAESSISGAAGTFDALAGTSLALQSGGITAAGAIAGATTIDASGDLTVGTITMSEFTVDSSGNTDIDGTLNVEGVPTFQAGAVFSSGITTAGAIAGATTVSASSDLNVGGTVRIDGAADATVDLDADKMYFMDDGDKLVKKQTVASVLQLAKGDGIQIASTGLMSIDYQLQHFSGSTGSAGLYASGSGANTLQRAHGGSYVGLYAPLDEDIVVGSLQVYLNGMLQTKSGSIAGTFDYELLASGSSANRLVKFVAEPDEDDAIVIQYIKK